MRLPRILVGAASSGAGKTSLCLGLMGALSGARPGGRGLDLRPFKAGPDYIDAGLHARLLGRPSRNLDPRLMGREAVLSCLSRSGSGGDLALIEGVMGYYDGEPDSSADLAALTGSPVILALDAQAAAESCAATALGFLKYRRRSGIRAFILNRIAGEPHFAMAKAAVERATGLPVIGYLPGDPALSMGERHLGLSGDAAEFARATAALAEAARAHVDLDALLRIAASAPPLRRFEARTPPAILPGGTRPLVAVARDEAFSFYYQDNLDELKRLGAELAFFSPIRDPAPPEGASALYLGGGYPELRASELSANAPMRRAIRSAALAGTPVYAECGGYLYLLESLEDMDGGAHPGCGLFPGRARMGRRLAALGYRDCATLVPSFLGPAGFRLSGHVFHYAMVADPGEPALSLSDALRPAAGPSLEGAATASAFGSFLHAHFAANPLLARRLVEAAGRAARAPRPGTA